jgi:CheY-like chemotaxis protein
MDRPEHAHALLPRVLRIVLIEDSVDLVHTTAFLLREMGHTVEYATNGYVALDVVRRFRPDVVLLDIGLPGADGFAVCSQIKADPELRGVQVYAVTAYSDEKTRMRARQVGFDGYYVKPIHPDQLAGVFGDPRANQAAKYPPHLP